jgi:CO dehydrogenase maturation factor
MANAMRDLGYRVLVLDTDESNPGLHRMFGFDREPKPLITLLTGFAENDSDSNADWLKRDEITFEDIPQEYVLESDGIKFLMVGKIADPLEGCACTMADLTRKLIGSLVTRNKEIVLADMEAGIESFGRGIEREVDTVLIIVEPSFESIALAGKIKYMADGIGVNKVRALVNKVPSEEIEKHILEELGKKEIISIGTVFMDPRIYDAGLRGGTPGDSDATRAVLGIARCLLN